MTFREMNFGDDLMHEYEPSRSLWGVLIDTLENQSPVIKLWLAVMALYLLGVLVLS